MARLRARFFGLGFPVATWYAYAADAQALLGVRVALWGVLLTVSSLSSIAAMRGYLRVPEPLRRLVSKWAPCWLSGSAGALVLSSSVTLTAVLLVSFGLVLGITQISLNARASELEEHLRRSIFTSCHGFFSIGVLAAGLVDFIAATTGAGRAAIVGSLALVSLLGVLLRHDNSSAGAASAADPGQDRPTTGYPRVGIIGLVLAAVGLRLMEGAVNTWHPYLIGQDLGFAGLSGAAYAAYAAGGVVARFAADAARSRLGILSATAVLGPLAVLTFAFSLVDANIVVMFLAMVLLGAALGIAYPDILKLSSVSGSRTAVTMMSLVLAGGTIGSLLANPVMGVLSELIPVRSAFLAVDCLVACAFAYITLHYVRWRRAGYAAPGGG